MADIQSILQNAPIPQAIRASAWDAYQGATDEDDLAARLNKLPIPNNVKADLWDAKRADKAATSASTAPAPAAIDKPRTFLDSATDFVKGYVNQMNPLPALQALYRDPIGTLEGIPKAQIDQFSKAKDAFDQGRYSEALGHTVAGAVPLVGPAAANVGEDIGAGNIAHGLGGAAALLTPFAIDAARGIIKKPTNVPGLNAAHQAAVDLADDENIPLTAGQRSGSQILKNVEGLIQNAPGGADFASKARAAQVEALSSAGDRIAGDINPQNITSVNPQGAPGPAVTAENAGNTVRSTLENKIADLHSQANQAYGDLRQIENDPANTRNVQVGTETKPQTVYNAQGQSSVQNVTSPVMKDVALPVDMRPVKSALQPIYDKLKETMPIAQQQANPGLKALENILSGDDHVPASVADQNLSTIKSIARADNPDLRSVGQGVAASAVKQLEGAVQAAVAQGGPDATAALQAGRAATKAKYAVADVLDQIKDEPVQTFNKLTAPKDANINLLRNVAQHAPDVMPDVGRAFVENLLKEATAEGGFDKTGTVLNKWNSLGPETRKILFQDPNVATRLDNFFGLAKKVGEVANPSKTAYVAQLVPTGLLLANNPVAGGGLVLGNAALSRMLFNPTAAKVLTKALTIPKANAALAASTVSQLLKLAGDAAQPQNATPALATAPQ